MSKTTKCDWYSINELAEVYPDLIAAIAATFERHPTPGAEGIVRIPRRVAALVDMVAGEWSRLNNKPADLFPYRTWAVEYAWVKYRKDKKSRRRSPAAES